MTKNLENARGANLKDKRILVLGWFPDSENKVASGMFIKEQVNAIKGYFKEVVVIDTVPYVPSFLHWVLPKYLRLLVSKRAYSYDNVRVYFPRFLRMPGLEHSSITGSLRARAVRNVIERNKTGFDLIHAHFTWPTGYLGLKMKEDYGKPLVLTVHENRRWLLKELESKDEKLRKIWRGANCLIRVNKKDLPPLKEINKNSVWVPNGVNTEMFSPKNKSHCRESLGIEPDKKVILNVAGFVIAHKNQINLLLAVAELAKQRKDIMLYLIGEGKDEGIIRKKTEELGLGKYVKILGKQSYERLADYMNAADVFALPSYSESFGIVQLEAMACGTPVVATVNGGSEEVIISGDLGFLLKDPNDYKGLAKLLDASIRKRWDGDYIVKYSENFRWVDVAKSLVSIYNELLGDRPKKIT